MYMARRKFIVEGEQIISTVRSALEDDFSNVAIVDLLMKNIENNVWTVLEDDCEEYEDDLKSTTTHL